MSRIFVFKLLILALTVLLVACNNGAQAQNGQVLTVYKSPTCGCCKAWVEHLNDAGFKNSIRHMADLNGLKADKGIAPQYQSCHTAISDDGYVFEGHIPARYIEQFLTAPPEDALGLAVPGMPVGSPGMEMGDRFKPYQVLLLKRDGSTEVFADVTQPDSQP
jgi:hypothetical protein